MTSLGSVMVGTGASMTRTSLGIRICGGYRGVECLPLFPYHWRVSWVSPGRVSGVLVVEVGRSPIAFWAWLATVVVRPGGVILSILSYRIFNFGLMIKEAV